MGSGSHKAARSVGGPMIARVILWSLWLPVSILVVFAVGDFSFGVYDERPFALLISTIFLWLPLMWLLGVPLTVAVQLTHRRSRILAVGVAAFCAPISVAAYILSVPLPSFLNSLLGALLAWLVVLSLYFVVLFSKIRERLIG